MTEPGRTRTAAVIQARAGSTRLPGKALIELAGIPMICHIIERAKLIKGIESVILATGEGAANDVLAETALSLSAEAFRGSEHDVLGRFYRAVKGRGFDYIIRITGDNPFTDYSSASGALSHAIKNSADHCYTENIPLGTGVEIISFKALEKSFLEGKEPHHREHVTPYIKENPELFRAVKYRSDLQNPFPHLRLTVDTEEDMKLASELYSRLYTGKPVPLEEVIACISAEPELAEINRDVKQRPMTHSGDE